MDNIKVKKNAPQQQGIRAGEPAATAGIPVALPSLRRKPDHVAVRVLHSLASLRLTVILFALSIILVFCGTLAQVDAGIWTVVDKYFRSLYVWIPLQIFFPRSYKVGGGFPFPGGWLIGTALLVNLLAAHAVRFKLSWKRSGIIVLHSGVILMMLGELITGVFAAEGSMLIYEGKSSNYVTNLRQTELAIVADGQGDTAEVAVVPMTLLRKRDSVIKNEALPFDVQVVQYMVNSRLCKQPGVPAEFLPSGFDDLPAAPRGTDNPATAGVGAKSYVALNQREAGGVEQAKEDQAAAYVRFLDKQSGKELGTYLLGVMIEDVPQSLTVDGKKYNVSLRLQRTYKPYSMHLIKFTHDVYEGTKTPKDFRSRVRLTHPANNEVREVDIYMNNPLYYGGETFYQQSYVGNYATILQVVTNPGWAMPYVSFFTVAAGLLLHFGIRLVSFLNTPAKVRPVPYQLTDFIGAGIAAGLGIVWLALVMQPARSAADQMQLSEAAKLPVSDGGRVMPLDTVARNRLMTISGRQTFTDNKGQSQSAMIWIMDVMTSRGEGGPAFEHKVFRIENDQVLALLDLKPRAGLRYSLSEILGRYKAFDQQFQRAINIPDSERTLFEAKVIELGQHLKAFQDISEMVAPRVIPPPAGGEWRTLRSALTDNAHQGGPRDAATLGFVAILSSYDTQDVAGFNTALANYQKTVDGRLPAAADKVSFETFFNNFAPFYYCMILYVFVFLLVCSCWVTYVAHGSWNGLPRQLRLAALALAAVTLMVHTFALLGRMYLMGRPLVFVTNLYSSAVFIGWVCVILGLVLEQIYKIGLGTFIASVTGGLTLLVGHYLATTGDTLEMMQAVLDTNFWLATHVTTVTFGYAATFVAGFLGIVYIVLNIFSVKVNKDVLKVVSMMTYGIICFAMLLSFVGTVLGGLWADYSWGRFWGWDPKENGALLIVLWNALILHARWCGLVQQRGVAVLAVAGNIVTSWSWFGVNMLGIGLHSYGFMSGAVFWLLAFVFSQLAIIAVGLVPTQYWSIFFVEKAKV